MSKLEHQAIAYISDAAAASSIGARNKNTYCKTRGLALRTGLMHIMIRATSGRWKQTCFVAERTADVVRTWPVLDGLFRMVSRALTEL